MNLRTALWRGALTAIALSAAASASVVDFENETGPSVFGLAGPAQTLMYNFGSVTATFSGGVVLTGAVNLPADPSSVYGTANFADPSLKDTLTISFSNDINNIFFDIFNGQTVTNTYLIQDSNGESTTITIPANTQEGQAELATTGNQVTVTSITTPTSQFDFFIDNVTFNQPLPVLGTPEPGSWGLMLTGFGIIAFRLRRRLRSLAGVVVASAAALSATAAPAPQFFGPGGTTINPTGSVGTPEHPNPLRLAPDLTLPNNGVVLPSKDGNSGPGILVNTATGNLYVSTTDIAYPGVGLPFVFTRSYNSLDSYSGPLGLGWTHSYNIFLTQDSGGNITIKEADGHVVVFFITEGGYLAGTPGDFDTLFNNGTSFVLTRRNQIQYIFNGDGQLIQILDRNGNHQDLSYTPAGLLLSVSDTSGRQFTFTYGAGNLLSSLTDPAGRTFRYQYVNGTLSGVQDPALNITEYSYNSSTQLVGLDSANDVPLIESVAYDAMGRVTQLTNGTGIPITFAYGSGSTSITDRRGNVTQHFYNANLQLIQVTDALGGITTTTYDSNNERSSVTNALGNTTSYGYDGFGNLLSTTDPLGNTTHYTYNSTNDRLTTKLPLGYVTASTYDVNGNRLTVKDQLGDTTHYAYDSHGQVTGRTDPNGHTTLYAYDSNGNLITVTDPRGGVTRYVYNVAADEVSFTNAKGNVTTYTWDLLHRLLTKTDPLTFVTQYQYNADGYLITKADPNGNVIHYLYDPNTELLTGINASVYQYDANANRISMSDGAGHTTTYIYDAVNRVTSIAQPSFAPVPHAPAPPRTVQYSWDAVSNQISVTYPDGKEIQYGYDADNRLIQVTDFLSNVTSYGYDKDSNRTSAKYANGTSQTLAYDAAGRLIAVTNISNGPSGLVATIFKYVLDPASNVLRATDALGEINTYTYDAANELLTAQNPTGTTTYSYDADGNRIGQTAPGPAVTSFTYDADDRMLTANSETFTYDADGNRISTTNGALVATYTYDARNRLIGASDGMGLNETFVYDPDGNRVLENIGSKFIEWVNDLSVPLVQELQELNGGGSVSYVRSSGSNVISEYNSGPGLMIFIQQDALGSVVGLTNSAGQQVAQGLYDPWGRIPSGLPAGFGVGGEFQFTGESVDSGTGFYYLRARYYDPQFGTFLSGDPYPGSDLQPLSENRYAYTRNNPLQLTDRTGFNPNRPIFCQDGCILFSPNTPADCPLPAFPGDPGLTTLR